MEQHKSLSRIISSVNSLYEQSFSVVKLSMATGHAMQIYNCLGQLRQL